jgi:hypothetical protein
MMSTLSDIFVFRVSRIVVGFVPELINPSTTRYPVEIDFTGGLYDCLQAKPVRKINKIQYFIMLTRLKTNIKIDERNSAAEYR